MCTNVKRPVNRYEEAGEYRRLRSLHLYHITKGNFVEENKRNENKMKEYEDSKLNKNHFCRSLCPIYLLSSAVFVDLASRMFEFELLLRKRII
jgi:hypothetical protein